MSCVVLATPEMVFELAESIRRHLCSFGSWKEMTAERERRVSALFFFLVSCHCFTIDHRRGRARFKYSTQFICCVRAGEGRGRKRITRGSYETKPRECALIFMSLWVWWWYNTCSKFFMSDETPYVGYIPQYWTSTTKTVMLAPLLGVEEEKKNILFPWQNYTVCTFLFKILSFSHTSALRKTWDIFFRTDSLFDFCFFFFTFCRFPFAWEAFWGGWFQLKTGSK